jgi:DNA-binding MarR family transcriptional regulator
MLESSEKIAGISERLETLMTTPYPSHHFVAEQDKAAALVAARQAYAARRLRDRLFGERLFSDPAWDLLLDLFIAHGDKRQVSVKSACIASSVPQTTALRYIAHLVERGLVQRAAHPADARIKFLELTERAVAQMTQYFILTRDN